MSENNVMESYKISSQRSVFGFMGGLGIFLVGFAALATSYVFLYRYVIHPAIPTPPGKAEHHFELVQLGTFRRDQYLLDQKTGRVWQSVCSGNISGADCDGLIIWEEMYVSDVTPEGTTTSLLYQLRIQNQVESSASTKK